jgi:hypothetical protein
MGPRWYERHTLRKVINRGREYKNNTAPEFYGYRRFNYFCLKNFLLSF